MFNLARGPISQRRVSRYSLVAGPEHLVHSLRKARSPGRMSATHSGERQEFPISAMQSNADRQENLLRSPIVFVIVQETRDPRFQ